MDILTLGLGYQDVPGLKNTGVNFLASGCRGPTTVAYQQAVECRYFEVIKEKVQYRLPTVLFGRMQDLFLYLQAFWQYLQAFKVKLGLAVRDSRLNTGGGRGFD